MFEADKVLDITPDFQGEEYEGEYGLCQVVFRVPLEALHVEQDSQNLAISFEGVSGPKVIEMLVADGVRGFLALREEMVAAKEPAVEAHIALDAASVKGRD